MRVKPGRVAVRGMLSISTRDRAVRQYLRTEYRHLRRVAKLDPDYARGALLRSLNYGAAFASKLDLYGDEVPS